MARCAVVEFAVRIDGGPLTLAGAAAVRKGAVREYAVVAVPGWQSEAQGYLDLLRKGGEWGADPMDVLERMNEQSNGVTESVSIPVTVAASSARGAALKYLARKGVKL